MAHRVINNNGSGIYLVGFVAALNLWGAEHEGCLQVFTTVLSLKSNKMKTVKGTVACGTGGPHRYILSSSGIHRSCTGVKGNLKPALKRVKMGLEWG